MIGQVQFEAGKTGVTQNEMLRQFFLQNPNREFGMPDLGKLIDAFAVHSRIADLRSKFGMTIVNRTAVCAGKRHSFYTYVEPPSATGAISDDF